MWITSLTLQKVALIVGLLMASNAYATMDSEPPVSDDYNHGAMSETTIGTAMPESSIPASDMNMSTEMGMPTTSNAQEENPAETGTDRPIRHYRPKIPKYHFDHPINEPVPPQQLRHPLVEHPELNTN